MEYTLTDVMKAIADLKIQFEETIETLNERIESMQETINNMSLPGRDYEVETYEDE